MSAETTNLLPRWRGFNLTEKFTLGNNRPFSEENFDILAEWGFDFVRLPMDYRCWTPDPENQPEAYDEKNLREIDQAVAYGAQRGIHVNLNLHRAPGYCVNPPPEPLDLWTDPLAQERAAAQWRLFAQRYRGIPSTQLSFDMVNEPARIPAAQYEAVMRLFVETIRAEDPQRLIVVDGLSWGNDPVPGLADLKIGQSTRGYAPMQISHYQASWVQGSDTWSTPTWPLLHNGETWDKERLRRERILPWKALQEKGVGVHVGEWGAHNRTPHAVALAWMRDCLELWKEANWGWALWNLEGSFGVFNSGRADIRYEDFRGRKLDRAMLELLRTG